MRRIGASIIAVTVLCVAVGGPAHAGYADAVRKGNKAFEQKDYSTALDQYRAAETDMPTSPEIDYNIGGALFEQGKYEEAVDKFTHALNTTDIKLAAQSHFNLGNTYYRMQDYTKAIQSYEEALKTNPKDMDAKFNLELARKMLKEHSQAQNQQKQQQNQKQQNQQDQQKQQQDQNKDQQKQQQQQQSGDQSDQNKDQQKQQPQQQQGNPKDSKKMSKEDAERILNALRDKEQDTQKKLKRQVGSGEYNGKDW